MLDLAHTTRTTLSLITAALLGPLLDSKPIIAATIAKELKTSIQRRVDYNYNPGIVIGLVDRNGRDFYSYGTTSIESGSLPDENTVYEVGSISKVFTATLLAQMVENDDLALSDPVASFLPQEVNFPRHGQSPITLEHLATHASGLPNNPSVFQENNPINPFVPFPPSALYEYLGTIELSRSPKDQYEYSNLGVGLLGHALSLHLETDYEQLLQERLFIPMGMNDTAITLPAELVPRRAVGYNGVVARPNFNMGSLAAAGEWLSTVNDMLTFLEHQLGLRDSEVNSILEETQERRFSAGTPGPDFGLGWFIIRLGSYTIHMHNGATLGHNAFAGFDLRARKGVVVLSNARLNQYANIEDLGVRSLVSNSPLNSIRRPANLSNEERQRLVGRYDEPDGTFFTIGTRHNQLTVTASLNPDSTFTVYPINSARFQLYELGNTATLHFSFGENGQVTTLEWDQAGKTAVYSKVAAPANLTLSATTDGLVLNVNGDHLSTYTIETSTDLRNWANFQDLSGGNSISIPQNHASPHQFFRVK